MEGNEVLQGEFYILIRRQREDEDAGSSSSMFIVSVRDLQ